MRIEKRPVRPKSVKNRLIREGKIPGVLYGPLVGNVAIAIDEKAFEQKIHSDGLSGVWTIELVGFPYQVVVKEVQRNPLTKQIMHIDMHQVDSDGSIFKVEA